MITKNCLFADGGVIKENPSPYGGTWAFRLLAPRTPGYELLDEQSGVILPEQVGGDVTNNQTEMFSVLMGLQTLPYYWQGVVCSDSNVTLGRLFRGDRWNNIPKWMIDIYRDEKKRLTNWGRIEWRLFHGHPSRAEIEQGFSNKGNHLPVSAHNARCDELCKRQAALFCRENGIK